MKKLSFDFVKIDPMAGQHRTPEFKSKFPALEDGNVRICEAHAIMTYLASKNHWHDVYPHDLGQRALVDQYLHWHHGNTRFITKTYFRPMLFGVFGKNELPRPFKDAEVAHINGALDILNTWLTQNAFIAGSKFSLADISAYCEFDQIIALQAKLPDVQCINFSRYPAIANWIKEMQKLPEHDSARKSLNKMIELIAERYFTLKDEVAKKAKL